MSLEDYLRLRAREFPALRQRAAWEIKELPEVLTADNFWYQVAGPVVDVGRDLCARMVRFCLDLVERTAERLRFFLGGGEPAPRQIMDDLNETARVEADNPGHEVWMYARAMEHPVVDGAVTNALNNRWGRVPAMAVADGEGVGDYPEAPSPRRPRGRGR